MAQTRNFKEEFGSSQEKHSTVVIKPQFFSNFHIVNIDNVIPFMGNNNPQVSITNGGELQVNSKENQTSPQQNTIATLNPNVRLGKANHGPSKMSKVQQAFYLGKEEQKINQKEATAQVGGHKIGIQKQESDSE